MTITCAKFEKFWMTYPFEENYLRFLIKKEGIGGTIVKKLLQGTFKEKVSLRDKMG